VGGAGFAGDRVGRVDGEVLAEHPLLRAMRQAEAHEAAQREVVRRKFRGPDPRVVLGGPISSQRARERAQMPEPPRITLAKRDEASLPSILGDCAR
jgi:hypothetical protein